MLTKVERPCEDTEYTRRTRVWDWADPSGCWLDGRYGQEWNDRRLIQLAIDTGWLTVAGPVPVSELADGETLEWLADEALEALNLWAADVLPDLSFGWHEGDLMLWDSATWNEAY